MSASVAPFGTARLTVLVALVLAAVGVFVGPAYATEAEGGAGAPTEEGPAPGIEEIGTQNEVSEQYLPEPAEPPPFMRFLYVPMILAGFLIAGALLFMYLVWQPRFAQERRSKRRR